MRDTKPMESPTGAPNRGASTDPGAGRTRLIPVTHWPLHHPWPTVPGLRWLIFNAGQNGFDAVVRRVGRRVLLDEQAFFRWVEGQNGQLEP